MAENGNGHHRRDDIEFKFPWGSSVRASGPLVVLIVVLTTGTALLFAQNYQHDLLLDKRIASVLQEQQMTNESVQDLMCVLTLTPDERIEARRGASLNKWCVFLNSRDTREVRKQRGS